MDYEINELLKLEASDIDELRKRYEILKNKIKDLVRVARLKKTRDLYKDDKFFYRIYESSVTETSAFMTAKVNGSFNDIRSTLYEAEYKLNKHDWKCQYK